MKFTMIITTLLGLALTISLFGCAAPKPMYYWGNYSRTLYHSKKNPGAESLSKHKATLENIIKESQARNLRIPPGVCAELGYLFAAQNNTDEAIKLFQMEKEIYPESTILMDRLIIQSKKRVADKDTSE